MNSNNEIDKVVTPTLVKDLDCPTDKTVREQQKCLDEVQERKCEDELKQAGVLSGKEFNQQKEEYKKIQEELMHRKMDAAQNVKSDPLSHIDDTDRHRTIQQLQKTQESRDQQQSGHERLHSSANGTSVDKVYGDPAMASTGYSPIQKITKGSLIQIPNGNGDGNIYGVVQWIGSMPSVEGLVAGIELVSGFKNFLLSFVSIYSITLMFYICFGHLWK